MPNGTSRPFSVLPDSFVNHLARALASAFPRPRDLSSIGITWLHWYCDPLRHPKEPVPRLTAPSLVSTVCQPPQGASRVAHIPSSVHAVAITPAETVGCPRRSLPKRRRPSPKCRRVGFRVTLFEASSAITARYGLHALGVPYGPFIPEASTVLLSPRPFLLLPAGTTLAGWDSYPLRLCPLQAHRNFRASRLRISNALRQQSPKQGNKSAATSKQVH